jgi:hypothetical protein
MELSGVATSMLYIYSVYKQKKVVEIRKIKGIRRHQAGDTTSPPRHGWSLVVAAIKPGGKNSVVE